MSVSQPAFELSDSNLAGFQEPAKIAEHRSQRRENRRMALHLVGELATAPESLPWLEMMSQVGISPRQAIQLGEVRRAEPAGKASSWQAQRLANRAHTHARQTLNNILGPTQWCQR